MLLQLIHEGCAADSVPDIVSMGLAGKTVAHRKEGLRIGGTFQNLAHFRVGFSSWFGHLSLCLGLGI